MGAPLSVFLSLLNIVLYHFARYQEPTEPNIQVHFVRFIELLSPIQAPAPEVARELHGASKVLSTASELL